VSSLDANLWRSRASEISWAAFRLILTSWRPRNDGDAAGTLHESLARSHECRPLRSPRAVRNEGFIVGAVTPAALILELPTHSSVPVWSAVGPSRFAGELFVAV
jgi:hypothetical protein